MAGGESMDSLLSEGLIVLVRLTAKNQLTLPKSITAAIAPTEYFDVVARDGQINLTPFPRQLTASVSALKRAPWRSSTDRP